jgi:hypothetical protein
MKNAINFAGAVWMALADTLAPGLVRAALGRWRACRWGLLLLLLNLLLLLQLTQQLLWSLHRLRVRLRLGSFTGGVVSRVIGRLLRDVDALGPGVVRLNLVVALSRWHCRHSPRVSAGF